MNTIINVQESKQPTAKRSGTLYRLSGNLLLVKTVSRTIPRNFVNTVRSGVVEFTAGSACRMRRYLRSCVSDYVNMVTLTYPGFFTSDGKQSKEHLRRYLQECKRYVNSDITYSSFWFLEFQERGAPHYHIFTTHTFPKNWVARTWYRIVNSEDERHLHAGTRVESLKKGRAGLVSYASKYAAKQVQKAVPDGYSDVGRFWGVSGHRATMSADTFVSRHARRDEGVRHSEKLLGEAVKDGIHNGQITEYRRERGVGVYILVGNQIWRRMMMKMSILTSKTMVMPTLFQDAEIDNGHD